MTKTNCQRNVHIIQLSYANTAYDIVIARVALMREYFVSMENTHGK